MKYNVNDNVNWIFKDTPGTFKVMATKSMPYHRPSFNDSVSPNEGTDYVIVKNRTEQDGSDFLPFYHVNEQHLEPLN